MDTFVDFDHDGDHELLWFYQGGRYAEYYYMIGNEIYRFDIIDAISERFEDWEDIELDPLSLLDDTIQLTYWYNDEQYTAQISFTVDKMIIQAEHE